MAERFDSVFLRRTAALWCSHYPEPLGEDDARAIAENATNFFETLLEWDQRVKNACGPKIASEREDHGDKK